MVFYKKKMEKKSKIRVGIIGTGVTGLALGSLLQRHKDEFTFTIFERDKKFETKNQGFSLTGFTK